MFMSLKGKLPTWKNVDCQALELDDMRLYR